MFLPLIAERRSIRRYEDRPVEREKIDMLVEAALRAPSSRGFDPWQFVVVTEKDLLAKLARAKEHGASFLKGAAVGIVVCADPGVSDVWVEDAAIATIFIQLAAQSLGLGSCWIQIRKRMHDATDTAEDFVRRTLSIPDTLSVLSVMAVGYPAEKKSPHPRESLRYGKVHMNQYGKPYGG